MLIVYILFMLKKGSIVSYKKNPAVIIEAGEKFTLEYPQFPAKRDGKITYTTQSVRSKDVIFLHEGPVSSVKNIAELAFNNPETHKTISAIEECWELLVSDESTQNETLSIQDLSELSTGSYDAIQSFHLYNLLTTLPFFSQLSVEDQKLPLFVPVSPEKVAIIRAKESEKEGEAQKKQEFIERLKKKNIDPSIDNQFMQEIEALALGKTDKSKFLKEAGFSETPESAHLILLQTKYWPLYKNPHPSRWGLSMQSAQETLSSPPSEERVLLNHRAFAIDNKWSTDPDDAIAFDGTYIWIHVADPASTVLPDSSIDITARNRGSTLYIPEGASRMLSEECLEDYALGLSKNTDSNSNFINSGINAPMEQKGSVSRALSFKIRLDANGAIDEVDVLKTMVEVKRLSYDHTDTLKDVPEIASLYEIAQKNIERRKKAGAVFIELPEVSIHISKDENGLPLVEISESNKTESSSVVREFMLLAGEAAARFAFKNSIPFPFVSQDAPDIPKELPPGLAGQYRLRRCMRSRSVGLTPSQHAGLGIGMYSQVTSPLRRYGDLVAHQQLRSFIDKKTLLSKDEVLERISAGDAAASASVKAERKSNLHWTLYYLLQNPDWKGKAVAVEDKGKQLVFLIPSLGMETTLIPSAKLQLNDEIMVKAGKINISELTVSFLQAD
jgi:exoribonuclease-2